ncbi:hypothetical protein [Ancylomarina sp.]|uniref:hypothetical protein n=1 Tax=Ancylomarina sp. TaxID=1970196 RepID=UPI00356261D7
MKNIYKLLIALVVLVGSAELSKAQSTYNNPWQGSSHTYTFGAMNAANDTEWYISQTAGVGVTPIVGSAGNHFTIAAVDGTGTAIAGDGTLSGKGISTVRVNWDGTASGTYYLYLKVTDAGNGCENLKGYKVTIAAGTFNAIALNVTGAGTPGTVAAGDPSIKTTTCPDQTGFNPIVNDGYDLGTSALVFRVNREFTNSVNAWQVGLNLTGATITSVNDEAGDPITAVGGNYPVAGDEDYVLVYVSVTNAESTPLVTFAIDKSNTKDLVTLAEDTGSGDSVTHTFNALPAIGNIAGGN